MLGHHSFTNIDGHDPDIMTAAPELPDFHRIKKNQHWIAHYFFQYIYCQVSNVLLRVLCSHAYLHTAPGLYVDGRTSILVFSHV